MFESFGFVHAMDTELTGILWLALGIVFECGGAIGIGSLIDETFPMIEPQYWKLLVVLSMLQILFLGVAFFKGRHAAASQSIGRGARCGVDVITVCAAILVRYGVHHSYFCILTLVSYTVLLHAIWHLFRPISDLGFQDAFVGALMQILVYEVSNIMFAASIRVATLCSGIILFRYWSDSVPIAPVIPPHKLLEKLPC
ncbi:hypothetical protein L1049_017000 [Liquidambar formosana]|uniref:Uncharacterized protein n=1 Tax=Liquidambar formosana TaxID=63359 RepID=A0AAP0S6J4_LIQFO